MLARPTRLLLSGLLLCLLLLPAHLSRAAQPMEVTPQSSLASAAAQRAPLATRSAAAAPSELFFSEYIEGSGSNKAIEIFNGTGAAVDLAAGSYTVELYANGADAPNEQTSLSGTIAGGDVYVIANASADAALLAQADLNSSVTFFNGDDALVLKRGGTVIDVIGQVGFDPGSAWGSGDVSTSEHTLRRKGTIVAGDSNPADAFDPAAEWDGYAQDSFDDLGMHATSGADAADLVAAKYAPEAWQSGENMIYALRVENTGVTTATNLVLTDTLPAGFDYISDTSGETAVIRGQDVIWNFPPLGPGAVLSFELFVSTSGSGTVTNTLTAASETPEANPADNSAAASTELTADPPTDLAISKAGPSHYTAGELIDYTLVVSVTNTAAENVVLTDTLPAGTTYVSDTLGVTPAGTETRTWSLGTLAVGVYQYTLRVRADAGTTAALTNSASIATATPEFSTANNSAATQVAYYVRPIGEVQGAVSDADDGADHCSPFAGADCRSTGSTEVAIHGVIYERTLSRTSRGQSRYGFFIQNTAASADGDPQTSDGIFVYMSRYTSLIDGYVPAVGDEVVLRGKVSEFYNLTQFTGARLVELIRSGVEINVEVPPFVADPPADLADAYRYWERREGMRGQVPAGSIVLGGRDVFSSSADGELWVVRDDVPLTECTDPYALRAFRDPHPCDNNPAELFDDGNGYRILMASLGVKAAAGDNTVLINPGRSYDSLTNAPAGGVYYAFGKYMLQVEEQPVFAGGALDPALNAAPQAPNRAREYSLATYNVENLYDYRDDPFDGCDFVGNSGCPGVYPPFNYVPASEEDYQAQLAGIATQIITDLHSPDILLVQEAEDQDVCSLSQGALACGDTNNADGRPDTLQELALVIAAQGGPAYAAAADRDGADDRGIISGFLYRTDRVELLPPSAADPVLGSSPQVVYRSAALSYNGDVQNPKALNAVLPDDVDTSTGQDGDNVFTRPPQVGLFRIWRHSLGSGDNVDLYALSNHFSSGPDRRVGQRTEQASYAAAIVAAAQSANAAVRVAVGGDFNVFPRPDDPYAPGDALYPTDQLGGLYELGLDNLWDVLVQEAPSSAYSYVYQGQTQTLDQVFVTDALAGELVEFRAAHINADWPEDYAGDGARGVSDHDPQVARFSLRWRQYMPRLSQ